MTVYNPSYSQLTLRLNRTLLVLPEFLLRFEEPAIAAESTQPVDERGGLAVPGPSNARVP